MTERQVSIRRAIVLDALPKSRYPNRLPTESKPTRVARDKEIYAMLVPLGLAWKAKSGN